MSHTQQAAFVFAVDDTVNSMLVCVPV